MVHVLLESAVARNLTGGWYSCQVFLNPQLHILNALASSVDVLNAFLKPFFTLPSEKI